ncbi:hypothetical protein M422DRAFT_181568 [Sphaerobolus stellatus SS14]|uniref:Uncharacterized protein n=1 Tax=Sphaerobolus stellatus (strain SS14) TaxID=990650 RepID=A0A0C9VBC9_SPHS4|nr:hypothetical protein M422DRAFT_181568 [Sphaerobolus stellatus SS14]
MSSIYTQNTPSMMRSRKMLFIIVWKVTGVMPKNMTNGSKSPLLVRKAAFHLSPCCIRTLL